MIQLFKGIEPVKKTRIYYGTKIGDNKSERFIEELHQLGFEVTTKPVKKMRLSIDARSVQDDSPALLKNFIRYPLLQKFSLQDIKYLNGLLYQLNTQGVTEIVDLKCNFDVELGRDMLADFMKGETETFVLCGSDSDFVSPIKQLLDDGKRVILLATARKIPPELNELKSSGMIIFEIKKLKEFLCWIRELGS